MDEKLISLKEAMEIIKNSQRDVKIKRFKNIMDSDLGCISNKIGNKESLTSKLNNFKG